jgi:hypothetical protein
VDRGAPELLLGELLAERALHDRRPCHEHLRGLPRHDREVRRCESRRREARHRADRGRDHRDGLEHSRDRDEAVLAVDRVAGRTAIRGALRGGAADAAAGAFEEADEGEAIAEREFLGVDALPETRGRGRAALLGEILAADDAGTVLRGERSRQT